MHKKTIHKLPEAISESRPHYDAIDHMSRESLHASKCHDARWHRQTVSSRVTRVDL